MQSLYLLRTGCQSLVANRVEPAGTSERRAGALLLGGLSALFPRIQTVIRVRQEVGVMQLEYEIADTSSKTTPPSSLFNTFARRIIGLLALAPVH
jgi:hypothetical protein